MSEMDSKNILYLLLKNKKNVVIILAIAVVCAIFFSSKLFIKPLYKSTVILYPTTTYSVSKAIMNTNNLIYVDPLEIGEEAQTEQMIQILNSGVIRDKIIEEFDLMNHYGIKENSEHKQYKLIKAYDNNVKIRRTEYNSVNIVVFDTDPEYAANIANEIAVLFDQTMSEMQQAIAYKALEIIEKEYNRTRENIVNLEDSLRKHPSASIYHYELDMEKANLNMLKMKYDDARINATETIPHKFVVTKAYVADKHVYPVRWLIVLVTFFTTLAVITMILAAFEYSENKNK
jgi:uncharacterized protein involved in exopolysaccharide biosynthesis